MLDYPRFVVTLACDRTNAKCVTLALTLGLKSLEKGYKTAILLLLDGVQVGCTGHLDGVDAGQPYLPARDLMGVYLGHGGQLMVSAPCWKNAGISDAERLSAVQVVTTDQVIDLLMYAKSTMQFT